jgi:hypothetical protein
MVKTDNWHCRTHGLMFVWLLGSFKDVDALQAWGEANRENSKELLTWIHDYMDTLEGQKYVVHIGPDAGR